MNYAIIAAGEGSRLVQEGVALPKPLVHLCGEPMIVRLINIFLRCGAESISIIVNEQMTQVREALEALTLPVPLHLVVKSTPSSMHSFHALSEVLPAGKFCLTTVDTVFRHMDIKAFCDKRFEGARFVSGGIYAMTDKAFAVLNDCMSRGVARMRNFQRALLDAQFHLAAYSIDKIVDVDHAADIATAEQFLTHHSL